MFNLLIVDDEYFMQDFLKNMVDWTSIGVKMVGVASDGQQALDILKENKIDIVITDVKMPKMDGLTLIQEASKSSPNTKFFVLSGYDDFESVRKSYRFGAIDYFLKTELTAETIYNAIGTLEFDIEKAQLTLDTKKFNDSDYMNTWRENQSRLNSVINGKMTYEISPPFQIIVFKLHKFDFTLSTYWDNDLEYFRYAIINVVQETVGTDIQNDLFFTPNNDLVAIIPLMEMKKCQLIFRGVSSNIMQCFLMKISGGISSSVSMANEIPSAYSQASNLSDNWYIYGKNKLIDKSVSILKTGFMNNENKIEILKDILQNISISNVLQNIPRILIDTSADEKTSRRIFDNYYSMLFHFAVENEILESLENEFEVYNSELKTYGDLNEQNKWLKKIIVSIAEKTSLSDNSSDMVIKYIAKNYSKDISLTDVANHIFVTPSYLSRMFEKWTGTTFAKYLNTVRIEKSLELIKKTNYKMFEISELVGFASPEHFSRTFKKITGVSPSEYLNNKDWKDV